MSERNSLLLTIVVYQVVLLAIGFWASRRTHDDADFYLGGRRLGPWVASLSSAASSSSAWSLLAVSGKAYSAGLAAIWLLPACVAGFALNWFVLAGPLRRLSASSGAVTVPDVLAGDARGPLRAAIVWSASIVILLSLGTYVASQFQGAGKTFSETLGMDPAFAVLVGGLVVLVYTLVGGFWAVSVTDTLQGAMMVAAAVVLPLAAWSAIQEMGGMWAALEAADPALLDLLGGREGSLAVGFIVGTFGIGLGYPGQPHVVNRFMALRDDRAMRQGRLIAMGWALVLYSGMLVTGWCARGLLGSALLDPETLFFRLSSDLFPPVMGGVLIAAVLSAIMSTADSQLLVCSSTVSRDIGGVVGVVRGLRAGRVTVLALGLAAIIAAVHVEASIFDTVLFAWSALGAAFGPLLLVRVLRGPVDARFSLAAIWVGFGVSVIWFFTPGLKGVVYELVPAFFAAGVVAWLGAARARGLAPRA